MAWVNCKCILLGEGPKDLIYRTSWKRQNRMVRSKRIGSRQGWEARTDYAGTEGGVGGRSQGHGATATRLCREGYSEE